MDEYLTGKERLKQLQANSQGDKVELLALLHNLLARYQSDSDIHAQIADLYLRLGNVERAARHYQKMYELDRQSRATCLKYAAYVLQYEDPETGMAILTPLTQARDLSQSEQTELSWLESSYLARKGDFEGALKLIHKVLAFDPWNVSFIVQEIVNLTKMTLIDGEVTKVDKVVLQLAHGEENITEWTEYDRATQVAITHHKYQLAFARAKIRFLYSNGVDDAMRLLVKSACLFDAKRGTFEFLRLLNTNFDGPQVYWALGMLYKELWQMEAASMWFEQSLMHPILDQQSQRAAYMELADCLVWRGMDFEKAIEFLKLAIDLGEKRNRAFTVMAHCFLKMGQIRQAELYLQNMASEESDLERTYLTGLVQYRNGSHEKANQIWKPLLIMKSESLRDHHIKQEILRYYFDQAPYFSSPVRMITPPSRAS